MSRFWSQPTAAVWDGGHTVESFLAGVVAGADIVEVDVRFTETVFPF